MKIGSENKITQMLYLRNMWKAIWKLESKSLWEIILKVTLAYRTKLPLLQYVKESRDQNSLI